MFIDADIVEELYYLIEKKNISINFVFGREFW